MMNSSHLSILNRPEYVDILLWSVPVCVGLRAAARRTQERL